MRLWLFGAHIRRNGGRGTVTSNCPCSGWTRTRTRTYEITCNRRSVRVQRLYSLRTPPFQTKGNFVFSANSQPASQPGLRTLLLLIIFPRSSSAWYRHDLTLRSRPHRQGYSFASKKIWTITHVHVGMRSPLVHHISHLLCVQSRRFGGSRPYVCVKELARCNVGGNTRAYCPADIEGSG